MLDAVRIWPTRRIPVIILGHRNPWLTIADATASEAMVRGGLAYSRLDRLNTICSVQMFRRPVASFCFVNLLSSVTRFRLDKNVESLSNDFLFIVYSKASHLSRAANVPFIGKAKFKSAFYFLMFQTIVTTLCATFIIISRRKLIMKMI